MKKKGKYQNAIVAKLLLCALLCPCILGACGGGGTAADSTGSGSVPVTDDPNAIVYYIDSENGDSSNDGLSPEKPLKSAMKLFQEGLQPGDTVLFRRGTTCKDRLRLKVSGTAEKPITVGAYGEGDAPLMKVTGAACALTLIDVSYVIVENLAIEAPTGAGIWIDAQNRDITDVTVRNCTFNNIYYIEQYNRADMSTGPSSRSAILIGSIRGGTNSFLDYTKEYKLKNVLISGCTVTKSYSGFMFYGGLNKYIENARVENCVIDDMRGEGMIFEGCRDSVATGCKFLRTCKDNSYYMAPAWFHMAEDCIIEKSEFGWNITDKDGMTVDFDGGSVRCTYQYIYSHDNARFMQNCHDADVHGPNKGNTVRYCLSINDNMMNSHGFVGAGSSASLRNLSFYNNVLINSATFYLEHYNNLLWENNIIVFADGHTLIEPYSIKTVDNNVYYGTDHVPAFDKTGTLADPGFVGGDLYDIASYVLSATSPIVGKGRLIDESVTEDIAGNPITKDSVMIGCFAVTGDKAGKIEFNPEPENILEIGTKEELVAFAEKVNAGEFYHTTKVILTADIDLGGMSWYPIGDQGKNQVGFSGIFDGQGHTISNAVIATDDTKEGWYGTGLFGTSTCGVFRNFRLVNFTYDGKSSRGERYGLVVGRLMSGVIENCYIEGKATGYAAVGGVVGMAEGSVNIRNCVVNVEVTTTSGTAAGGIIAYNRYGECVIKNCLFTGKVNGGTMKKNGALIGETWKDYTRTLITDSYYLDDGNQKSYGCNGSESAHGVIIETGSGALGRADILKKAAEHPLYR